MKYYKNCALNMAPEPSYPCKYAISHLDESLYIQRSKCLQQPFPSDVTFKLARRCVHGFTYKIKTPYCYNSIHTGFTPTHRHKTHAHTSFVSHRILFYTACSMRAYCTSVASCSLCKRHRDMMGTKAAPPLRIDICINSMIWGGGRGGVMM